MGGKLRQNKITPPALPPSLELRSLRRTRALIGWQKWLFGFGICFTAIALTSQFLNQNGHIKEFHFLVRDFPAPFGSFAVLAIACWIGYYSIRRHRLRIPKQRNSEWKRFRSKMRARAR